MELEKYCEIVPKVQYLSEFDLKKTTPWYGIKALCYEGAKYHKKKTKIFAYIGFPEQKDCEYVPAVVLVHGGGGHAYAEWIRRWNEKGFAAIAMDTTGYFPNEEWKGQVGTAEGPAVTEYKYVHDLPASLKEKEYITGPDNIPENRNDMLPIEEQWFYHGVADIILAHNILRADSRINSKKIGIVGISWGSVLTTMAMGYDTRYAFAIPIYGSAYLDCLPAPKLPQMFRKYGIKKKWSAAKRLGKVKFPVLWLCQLEDTNFSFKANSLSYLATKKEGAVFSIQREWEHSHGAAWNAQEGYRFASEVLKEKLPLIGVLKEPEGFGEISFELMIPEDFQDVSAKICYSSEPLEYGEDDRLLNEWKCVKAVVKDSRVYGSVPETASCYFVELSGAVDGECYISNTALIER